MDSLLVIDPQNDFHPGGALAVPGANEDSARLAALLAAHGDRIGAVHITLDSHHPLHIAHSLFWTNEAGEAPAPFTVISVADVEGGVWRPTRPEHAEHCLAYVRALEAGGRYALCIWPTHCLIGSPGHNVRAELAEAANAWAAAQLKTVNYVAKGQNPLTEMYSCFKADVVLPEDPSTRPNTALVEQLQAGGRVLVGGEALSHCVAFSVRDLADMWSQDPEELRRIVILTDCASSVPGFEAQGQAFLDEMRARGLTLCTSAEAFA